MKKIFTSSIFILGAIWAYAQSGSETFTVSGSFTVPDSVTSITIEVVGAGGSGGGNGTGGGGGGGYASGTYTVTPLDVLTVTIGSPGLGSVAGTTSVGDLISATGGVNGVSVDNPEIGGGGTGGIGIGGNISNFTGGNGGGGYFTYFGGGGGGAAGVDGNGSDGGNTIAWTGICFTPGGDGGLSGGLPGGNGGKGAGFVDDICSVSDPSEDGFTYGGGGGGGNGNGGGPGDGAAGYCIISYMNCSLDTSATVSGDTMTANASGISYQWIDCVGYSIIPGATSQSYIADTTGYYAVIVSDDGCVDTSGCQYIQIIVDGIMESPEQTISIYPNPFSSTLNIKPLTEGQTFELLNATGVIIWRGEHLESGDFSSAGPGIYILKIIENNKSQFITLIKEK